MLIHVEGTIVGTGETVDPDQDVITLNYNNEWDATYQYPRYDSQGREIIYKVTEVAVKNDPVGFGLQKATYNVNTVTDEEWNVIPQLNGVFANTYGPGEGLSLDVYKEWADGSDLLSRHTVKVAVFHVNSDGTIGEKVSQDYELNEGNYWYERIFFSKVNPTDTVENYVVKEVSVNGVEVTDASNTASDYRVKSDDLAKQNVVGHLAEGDSSHNLDYDYDVLSKYDGEGTYTVTNRRTGVLKGQIKKTWIVGTNEVPDTEFTLYQAGKAVDTQTISGSSAEGSDGVYTATVVFGTDASHADGQSYPKYDVYGESIDYAVAETKFGTKEIKVETGGSQSVQLASDKYITTVSQQPISSETDDEAHTYVAPPAKHHTNDMYRWVATNRLSDSYSINVNKVWGDDGTDKNETRRPDVTVNVYRVSAKDLPSDWASMSESARASWLAGKGEAVAIDKEWNTKHNDFWWSCELGTVARYDANGYPYVYYAQERYVGGTQGHYIAVYANDDASTLYPTGEGATSTTVDKVFNTNYTQLDKGNADGSGMVTIVADGTQEDADKIGTTYTRTVVNYREDVRTITGVKYWQTKEGWAVPEDKMPSIDVTLYRFNTAMENDEFTQAELNEKIASDRTAYAANTATLNNSNNYRFTWTSDASGNSLVRYDAFGQSYHYYISENAKNAKTGEYVDGYSASEITIIGNSFTINNLWNPEDVEKKVEVTFSKTWEVDAGKTNLQDKVVADLAAARFNLYAQATDADGNKIGEKVKLASTVIDPKALADASSKSATTTFTFDKITIGDDSGALLPYTGPNGNNLVYWVEEEDLPNGYVKTATGNGTSEDTAVNTSNFTVKSQNLYTYKVGDSSSYDNSYKTDDTSITVKKTWSGEYDLLDNSIYRPESVDLTVKRVWADASPAGVKIAGGEEYVDLTEGSSTYGQGTTDEAKATVKVSGGSTEASWTVTRANLPKYAPNGAQYTYKVVKEVAHYSDEARTAKNELINYTSSTSAQQGVAQRTNKFDTVYLAANKTWKQKTESGTTNMSAAMIRYAAKVGAIPTTIVFRVQRMVEGGSWEYVEATKLVNSQSIAKADAQDSSLTGDGYILGAIYDVASTTANPGFSTEWRNLGNNYLPKCDTMGNTYTYRVQEVHVWADGHVSVFNSNDSETTYDPDGETTGFGDMTSSASGTTTKAFTNTITMRPTVLVKKWDDVYNRDNTRPQKLNVKVEGKTGTAFEGFSQTIALTRTDTNTYTSATFYLPTTEDNSVTAYSNMFTVTETDLPAEYTQTKNADIAYNEETGRFEFNLENKYDGRKKLTASATKKVEYEYEWGTVTRGRIDFTLMVKDPETGKWVVANTIAGGCWDEAEAEDVTKTVTWDEGSEASTASSKTSQTVTWNNLYTYYDQSNKAASDASIDTKPYKLVYGIMETVYDANGNVLYKSTDETNTSEYTPSDAVKQLTGSETALSGTFTNTAQTMKPIVQKTWTGTDGSGTTKTYTADEIQELVNLKAIPEKITFKLQCKTTVDSDWWDVAVQTNATFSTVDLLKGVSWNYTVPEKDKNGKEIQYRLVETSFQYKGDTTAIEASSDKNVSAQIAEIAQGKGVVNNTYMTTAIGVTKTWDDANDQDGVRDDYETTFQLYRDGEAYGNPVTVNVKDLSKSDWSYTWSDLPQYKKGSTEESVYTVKESSQLLDNKTYTSNQEGAEATVAQGGTAEFTNTHTPETVSVPVEKVWDDADNQDGQRPTSITVQLKANGKVTDSVVLNDSNEWKHTFGVDEEGNATLPKYSDHGQLISYTVEEVAIDESRGYQEPVISGNATDGYKITNSRTIETVTVNGEKTWNDGNATDRPSAIEVTLTAKANGEDVTDFAKGSRTDFTKTVTANDNWKYEWNDLPKHYKGIEIAYTVTETAVEGYTTDYENQNPLVWNIKNTKNTTVSGTKTWVDNAENRPTEITVKLLKGSEKEIINTKTVTASDNWAYTFTEDKNGDKLRMYDEQGNLIVYSVSETVTGNNSYKKDVSGYDITNTLLTEVPVTKAWVDDNVDRPTSITVKLKKGTEVLNTHVMSAGSDGVWSAEELTYTFTEDAAGNKLPKYEVVDGKDTLINYTVDEEEVAGYFRTISGTEDPSSGWTITNTELTGIEVTKVWNDSSDADQLRPQSITVKLLSNGNEVNSAELNASNEWHYSFSTDSKGNPLPKTDKSGKAIEYTVSEVEPADSAYISATTGTMESGYTITNTEWTVVNGTKTWVDNEENRPESITINLLANGEQVNTQTVKANEQGAWAWSFSTDEKGKKLPKYTADGTEIAYTVTEVINPADKYDVTYADVTANKNSVTTGVTNTLLTTVPVTKVWTDGDESVRPTSITVKLMNGSTEVNTHTLSAGEDKKWSAEELTYTFTKDAEGNNLPKYTADGQLINYTVVEDAVSGYTTAVAAKGEQPEAGYTITNTLDTKVDVAKKWLDGDNADGKRASKITVNLKADDTVVNTAELNAGNDWKYSFTTDKDGNTLPKYKVADGKNVRIQYTVEEVASQVPDYISAITGTMDDGYTITNTEWTTVPGSKTWVDGPDAEGRPESITINLLANGSIINTATVEADEQGDWKWEFTTDSQDNKLPKYDTNDNLITYTVTEDAIDHDGYTFRTDVDGYDVTNTLLTTVPYSKVWVDGANLDKMRPGSITVNLYSSNASPELEAQDEGDAGKTLVATATLKATGEDGTWTEDDLKGVFTEDANGDPLPKYTADGTLINYTVEEEAVAKYATVVTADGSIPADGYTITNTLLTEVPVTKKWEDGNNADGLRPSSIKVTLLQNGTSYYGEPYEIMPEADGTWAHTFTELPKYATDGTAFAYTVEEEAVTGYSTAIEGNALSGYTITNTELTQIDGSKTWVDNNNRFNVRPAQITITLYKGTGSAKTTVDELTVTADNNWAWSFTQLPKYENGTAVEYSIAEQAVEYYTSEVVGYDVINTADDEYIKRVLGVSDDEEEDDEDSDDDDSSSSSSSSKNKAAQTGDMAALELAGVLALGGLAGIVVLQRRKREAKEGSKSE